MFFSQEKTTKRILTISKIEEDILSQTTNDGDLNLSFKIESDTQIITIKFYTFNDWLGSFGSFFAICTALASFFLGFFLDSMLDSNILNSLFYIVDNDENNFKQHMLKNGGSEYISKINKKINKKREKLKRKNKDKDKDKEKDKDENNEENKEVILNDFVFTKEEIKKYYEIKIHNDSIDNYNSKNYNNIEENNKFINEKIIKIIKKLI
jgi:hypothetical protein